MHRRGFLGLLGGLVVAPFVPSSPSQGCDLAACVELLSASISPLPILPFAHWLPVTDEMLDEAADIRAFLDARLRPAPMLLWGRPVRQG